MKITVKNDIRNQKAGTIYDFSEIELLKIIPLAGDNGCGKSTLLHAIRGSFREKTHEDSLYESGFKKLAENFDIEHSYEKFFFFDAVKDNALDMNVSFDAVNFLMSGGMAVKNLSHGQSSLYNISKFFKDNVDKIIPDKTLLVFDEIDNGLSLKNMKNFTNFIDNMIFKYCCHVIIASHNPFFLVQQTICYDISKQKFVPSDEYVEEITGFIIKKKPKE